MPAQLKRKRALFVLTKIDEILAWEKQKEAERDTRFVELGRNRCEVRAGQYWRLEKLRSFDEFLARRFPESRRKAYYLMSIHEHLPPQARKDLKEVGWTKGAGASETGTPRRSALRLCNLVAQSSCPPKEDFRREVEKEPTGKEIELSEPRPRNTKAATRRIPVGPQPRSTCSGLTLLTPAIFSPQPSQCTPR